MCLMGKVELPIPAIRAQIASGIDILVHLSRFRDKSRRVRGIYEVRGMENGEVVIAPIFIFKEDGKKGKNVSGRLERTEEIFQNTGKFEDNG